MQGAKRESDVGKPEDRGDGGRGEGEEDEEEEEEEEEVKIEQFFAILRNYREARNRMRIELMGDLEREREAEESRRKRRRLAVTDGGERCSSWVPRFEPEDFSADVEFRTRPLPLPHPLPHPLPPPPPPPPLAPPATAISPVKAAERERKVSDDGLELKLTI